MHFNSSFFIYAVSKNTSHNNLYNYYSTHQTNRSLGLTQCVWYVSKEVGQLKIFTLAVKIFKGTAQACYSINAIQCGAQHSDVYV